MTTTDVLVIGAGPTGLTAANVLDRSGVEYRIIDKKAGPTDESRALFIQPKTLEYWDKLGLAEGALEKGQIVTEVRMLVEGEPYGGLAYGGEHEDRTPFPFALVYEQSKSERLLIEGLEKTNSHVEWETELLDISQTEEGVTAVLGLPDGSEETVTVGWVIGADGTHSPVRHALGLQFEGDTYEQGFFLADVDMEWPFGYQDLFLNLTRDGFLGFFPMQGDGQFRIIGSLTSELRAKRDADEKVCLDDIREAAEKKSGVEARLEGSRWITTYRLHSRMTERFRVGRIFLAGDAAHIHSPAGGQGMNTGVGDAYNLAWKVSAVVKEEAHPELLDSYEAERVPFARSILRVADQGFRLEVGGDTPVLGRLRMVLLPPLLSLTGRSRLYSRWFFWLISQIRTSYRQSPAVSGDAGKGTVRPGDRVPHGLFEDGTSLYDLFRGTNHHLLIFESAKPDPTRLEATREEIESLLDRYKAPVSIQLIAAENRELHKRYGAKTASLFLVRPDGHIAYRGAAGDIVGLRMYLDRLFTKKRSNAGQRVRVQNEVRSVRA